MEGGESGHSGNLRVFTSYWWPGPFPPVSYPSPPTPLFTRHYVFGAPTPFLPPGPAALVSQPHRQVQTFHKAVLQKDLSYYLLL